MPIPVNVGGGGTRRGRPTLPVDGHVRYMVFQNVTVERRLKNCLIVPNIFLPEAYGLYLWVVRGLVEVDRPCLQPAHGLFRVPDVRELEVRR